MQHVAMGWLVYRLTGSPLMLGIVGFCTQIPSLVLTPAAGVVADRFNRHRILLLTQALAMAQALTLAGLVYAGVVTVWHVIPLALLLGCINAFDLPARQSFFVDMIGDREDLANAIALNSSMVNGSRLVGPSLAGLLIARWGEQVCFLINGVSYIAVIGALLAMRLAARQPAAQDGSFLGGVRDGLLYAGRSAPIRALLLLVALTSLMGMPYTVLLPVFASKVLGGEASLFGFLAAAPGVGALCGAIWLAARRGVRGLDKAVALAAILFGAGLIAFSLSRVTWLSLLFLGVAGFGLILQLASSNTILQTIVEDRMRGRVMSLYIMALIGVAPFGSLVAGALADLIGAPATLALGGTCCLGAGLLFGRRLPHLRLLDSQPAACDLPEMPT